MECYLKTCSGKGILFEAPLGPGKFIWSPVVAQKFYLKTCEGQRMLFEDPWKQWNFIWSLAVSREFILSPAGDMAFHLKPRKEHCILFEVLWKPLKCHLKLCGSNWILFQVPWVQRNLFEALREPWNFIWSPTGARECYLKPHGGAWNFFWSPAGA